MRPAVSISTELVVEQTLIPARCRHCGDLLEVSQLHTQRTDRAVRNCPGCDVFSLLLDSVQAEVNHLAVSAQARAAFAAQSGR